MSLSHRREIKGRTFRWHWLERAHSLYSAGGFSICARRIRSAAHWDRANPDSLHFFGASLVRRGAIGAGIFMLAKARDLAPHNITIWIDHAQALGIAGRLDDGIRLLQEGGERYPDDPDLVVKLGEFYSDAGRFEDALRVLSAGVSRFPRNVSLHVLLAAEYAACLKTKEALIALIQARALSPKNSNILVNIGVLYQAIGDIDMAIAHYRQALALDPERRLARPNLATALLTRFEFEAGFAEFESRFAEPHIRNPETGLPRWQGEDLADRRLLVTAEQGYGDMLQFARFVPPLSALGADITLECQPGLERLFAALPGVDRVITIGQAFPDADVTIPLLSLPFLRGCSIDQLAASIPYLDVPSGTRLDIPDDGLLKVGLVWAGRPASGEVYLRRSLNRRSCPLATLAPLMAVPSVRFYGLQVGEPVSEISSSGLPIVDLSKQIGDFADTAAVIAGMDLVISIDTATAHLAGGMGAPLWVLLSPGQVDYRWGTGNVTPWYPHARLFRADRSGWTAIVERMAAELGRMAKYHARQRLSPSP
jgi:Flp pilus assembly protein TadD